MAGTSAQIIELASRSGIANQPGSTYRAGATTASGSTSWHASDKAVDFMGYSQDALASFFMGFPTLEVIHHSDKTGKNYASSNGRTYDLSKHPTLLQQHRNHLHVAMSEVQVGPGSILEKLGRAGSAVIGALPFVPDPQTVTDAVANLARPLAQLGESALSVGAVANAITRAMLPGNLLRGVFLFQGLIFILIGIWFLSREIRESQ
jgi:hypothetical protein